MIRQRILFLLLLLVCTVANVCAEDFPAQYKVTANTLNIRRGPGISYSKMGILVQGDYVNVKGTTYNNGQTWGEIDCGSESGYVAMSYLEYIEPLAQQQVVERSRPSGISSVEDLLLTIWKIIKIIFWIFVVLIVFAFKDEILEFLAVVGAFVGIGALIGWLVFDHAGVGAIIGLGIVIFFGLRLFSENLSGDYNGLLYNAYRLTTAPLFYTNRWQHILSEPWRYILKTDWPAEDIKPALRIILQIVQIALYVAITPLRLFNAIAYNLVVHVMMVLYDLFIEVFKPSSWDEEGEGFFGTIIMFFWRLLKYPIFHGAIAVIEGFIWTVIDILIPAVTLYHGTDLTAAQAIVCCPNRNRHLRYSSTRTHGTFAASRDGWGGNGVYFASKRTVAMGYALDDYRLGDNNPCMIVCRVSLGSILNYALSPHNVFRQGGDGGNHNVMNDFALKHHYVTGEWWNYRHSYWEYCLYDWGNRYDHPWRIRPIYVFNIRTCRLQHIEGGMQHWLFDRSILSDLYESACKHTGRFVLFLIAYLLTCWVLWLNSPFFQSRRTTYDTPQPVVQQEEQQTAVQPEPANTTPPTYTPPTYQQPLYNQPSYCQSAASRPVNSSPIRRQPTYSQPAKQTKKHKSSTRKRRQTEQQPPYKGTGFHFEHVDQVPTSSNRYKNKNETNNNNRQQQNNQANLWY